MKRLRKKKPKYNLKMRVGAVVELLKGGLKNSMTAKIGARAVVTTYPAGYCEGKELIDVKWIRSSLCPTQTDGGYFANRFKVVR